jgi:NADPH:quinone reductase
MSNAECGSVKERQHAFHHSAFRVFLILYILSIPVNFSRLRRALMAIERMRAVRFVSNEGAGELEVAEVERPVARADRVRVRVRAAALNRADILQKRGRYPAPPGASADIPGLEFAGEVEQTGDEARAWKSGQRVFGITAGGAQAEYVVVPESHLAEIPERLSFEEAAAVPEVFITAHDALFTQARLETGERVLVHAVGSGVGTAAAASSGARGGRGRGLRHGAHAGEDREGARIGPR